MLDRLVGLESEYAIRITSSLPQWGRLHHLMVYRRFATEIGRTVKTREGTGFDKLDVFFTENGGSFSYEGTPGHFEHGLLEGATPECRSPTDVLLYQRAQERLLARCTRPVADKLALLGVTEVGLLRNCRDAEGNIYGAQENYEVIVASGLTLGLYRAALLALTPVLLIGQLVGWLILAVVVAAVVAATVGALVLEVFGVESPALSRLMSEEDGESESLLMEWLQPWLSFLGAPLVWPQVMVHRAFAFRRIRQDAMAFLVSRIVLLGEGTVEPDGTFHLSEKTRGLERAMRSTAAPADHAIIDTGHFIDLWIRQFAGRFAKRQRLQLGLSFGNRCQVAEYLKIGTTSLLLDMVEANALRDAPRLADPVAAAHAIGADPTLQVTVAIRGGPPMTALDLQRFYLERAEAFVADHPTPRLEATQVLTLWREALDGLARDPTSQFGRLDWVTKRVLIEEVGPATPAVLKKVDLRYHEIGDTGYHAWLEAEGLSPTLVDDDDVEAAIRTPPQDTRARVRGQLVRELSSTIGPVAVDWSTVRVGGWLRGQVIRLDAHRDPDDG